MNTSPSLDARSLAHRLTAVGHALHHRLFEQLRESDLDPRTAAILGVIDGRIDAPWISDRIARGGKRVTALAERGWIERVDDAWTLTADGRATLERIDADRVSVMDALDAEQLAQLTSALDALSDSLGVDATNAGPRGFRGGRGFGPAFGPGYARGFGGPGRGRNTDADHADRDGRHAHAGHHDNGGDDRAESGPRRGHPRRDHGCRHPFEGGRPAHRHGDAHGANHGAGHDRPHRAHRAAQRAFERGFDAGFSRGRESMASE